MLLRISQLQYSAPGDCGAIPERYERKMKIVRQRFISRPHCLSGVKTTDTHSLKEYYSQELALRKRLKDEL